MNIIIALALILAGFVAVKAYLSKQSLKKAEDFILSFTGIPSYLRDASVSLYMDHITPKMQELYTKFGKKTDMNFIQLTGYDGTPSKSLRVAVCSDPFCKAILNLFAQNPPKGFSEFPPAVGADRIFNPETPGYLYVHLLDGFGSLWVFIPKNTEGQDCVIVEIHPQHSYADEWGPKFQRIKNALKTHTTATSFEAWARTPAPAIA